MPSTKLAVVAALVALLSLATAPALAQDINVGSLDKVEAKLTVESIDPATRHVVLKNEAGTSFVLKAPAEVRNFDQLKVGDTIKATYVRETEIAIAPRGRTPPDNVEALVAARAAKGDLPAALVGNHITVTGAIVGVDTRKHIARIVNRDGGAVHEIAVTTPEGRQVLGALKPGDNVIAQVTEGLLLAVERD